MAVKSRILFLERYLYEYTDDDHALTTQELIDILHENGFKANRVTLKNDIESLIEAGYDIITEKSGKANTYHYGTREFDYAQLQMLTDAVSSARFLTEKKSRELIDKIASICGKRQKEQLTARVYSINHVKADNSNVFIISDIITEAINRNRKISFQYYDYNGMKEKILRNGGEVYLVSPYAMVWNDDRYYLIAYSDKHKKPVSFRVDRMCLPEITTMERYSEPNFSVEEYVKTSFKMYSGHCRKVILKCETRLMQNVIDRFGEGFPVQKTVEAGFFQAKVSVEISPPFYAWVFQFDGGIRILAPEDIRNEYDKMLSRAMKH